MAGQSGVRMVRIDRRSGKRVFDGWPTDDPKSAIIWEAFKPESEPRRTIREDEIKPIKTQKRSSGPDAVRVRGCPDVLEVSASGVCGELPGAAEAFPGAPDELSGARDADPGSLDAGSGVCDGSVGSGDESVGTR